MLGAVSFFFIHELKSLFFPPNRMMVKPHRVYSCVCIFKVMLGYVKGCL